MTAAKVLLAAALLWALAGHADIWRLGAPDAALRWPFAIVAVLLLIPNIGLQYAKWRLLLRRAAPESGAREALRSLFAGFALGLVTPARAGEFGGRSIGIARADAAAIAGATVVDKLASMLATLCAGLAGLAWSAAMLGGLPPALLTAAALAVPAAGLAGLSLMVRPRNGDAPMPAGRVARFVRGMLDAARSVPGSVRARLLGLSAAFVAVFIAQFALLLLAFGAADAGVCIAGAAAVMLVKTVIPPVSFGELGIRESVAVFVLTPLGVAAGIAFRASLALFTINVLAPALCGAAMLFAYRGGRRSAA